MEGKDRFQLVKVLMALIYAAPVIYLSWPNFDSKNFCIVNRTERICKKKIEDPFSDIDCFKLARNRVNPNIEAHDYDIGGKGFINFLKTYAV